MKAPLLARAILSAFLFLFAFAAAYLLLDSLGIWERLPAGLTRGLAILSGLILLRDARRPPRSSPPADCRPIPSADARR